MAWTFNTPMATLSDAPTVQNAEQLWEKESLGGLTEDNNPIPVPVVWLVFLTVCTAFCVTFPLWGQRPTAALYAPFVHAMSDPSVVAAKDDTQAMLAIGKLIPDSQSKDTLLARHPLTMDQLREIAPQIQALEARPRHDLKDYTVVGDRRGAREFRGQLSP